MQKNEFSQMVIPYKDKLYRFALRIVGDSFTAEDVVQEVMIKVWKKREYFETIDNKEAWCMTLTKNLAIDKTRSKHKRNVGLEVAYAVNDNAADPYQATASEDSMSKIRELMEALPEKQRMVIHLRDIEEMSYDEISEITSLTTGQVKINLHRARKTLRSQLINMQL
jgi:RNA polymerase sigma-70 factor (ECF subfamily)